MKESESIAGAVERYLREGTYESDHPAWPGNVWDRARRGHDELLAALVAEVRRRAADREHAPVTSDLDLASWTRRKVTPMVAGLFPAAERGAVLKLLERSVVFLTDDNIEQVLLSERWPHTAWRLANLYLSSVDAELLGSEAPSLLGLSAETTCYVSADYFGEQRRFDDYVIHEVAHVFRPTACASTTPRSPDEQRRSISNVVNLFGPRHSGEGRGEGDRASGEGKQKARGD